MRVLCIDSSGWGEGMVEVGRVYTVVRSFTTTEDTYYELNTGVTASAKRFILSFKAYSHECD